MSFEKKYEEWKKKQTENKGSSKSASFEDRYVDWQMRTRGEDIVNDLSSRFNSWLSDYDRLAKDYSSRYSNVDASKYRSDTDDWLSKISSRAQSNKQNALEIKEMVDQYKNYLNPEWVKSFYDALSNADKYRGEMISGAGKEKDYWSQWDSEEAYTNAVEKAKADKERWDALTNGYDPTKHAEQGQTGWNDYLAYNERIAQNTKKPEKEAWWERLGRWLGYTPDTSLPMIHNTRQMAQGYQDAEARKTVPDRKWEEEYKLIYGYLWNTDRSKASEFAYAVNNQKIIEEEQERIREIQAWATDNFGAGAAHTLGAIVSAPLGLSDFLGDVIAQGALGYIPEADGTITPFEYSQAVTGSISQKLNENGTLDEDIPIIGGKGWGDVYGLGTSIAQSALSAYTSGPIGTAVNFFGSSAASAVDDALSRGATGEQAILYGLCMGVAEAGAESIGVDNLFKVGASKTLKDFFVNTLKQAGAEGMEEGITALLGNIADNVVMQDKSNFNALVEQYMSQGMSEEEAKTKAWLSSFEEIAFDTLSGAVSGGVHAAPHTAVQTIQYNNALTNTGKAVLATNGGYDALKNLADEVSSDGLVEGEADIKNLVAKAQTGVDAYYDSKTSKRQKNKTAKQVGMLSETIDSVRNEQNLAEIRSLLESKGLSKSQANKAAQLLNEALYTDGAYSKELYESVMNDQGVWDTLRELVTSPDSSLKSRNLKHKLGRLGLKVGEDGAITSSINAEEAYVDESLAFIEDASKREYTASTEGKSIVNSTGETVDIVEVASIKDGQMMLKVKDADGVETEVNARDVSYASESEALVYEAVANMGLDAVSANSILKTYNPTQDAATFARGVQEAYRYGRYNFSEYEMYQEGNFLLDLTDAQIQRAYKLGQIRSGSDIAVAVARLKEAIANSNGKKGEGKVHYEGDAVNINEDALNDRQKTGLKTMEMLSKALGLEFYVYSSYTNKKGERVYKTATGEVKSAPNGWYDKKTGAIHIDLNAGDLGEGTMLFTVAHELTHFIKAWSPAKFKVLANFLVEQYGKKGVSVETLVRRQMAHMKASGRKNVTYDLAFEEFVADSMQTMLKSGNVVESLVEIKRRDEGLWNKIKEFFSNIVDLLKKTVKAYEGYGPDTVEGQTVAEMTDVIEQFENLFAEALADASENYRYISSTEQQTLAEAGIGFDADTRSVYSLRYSTGRKDALGNVIDLVTVGKKNFDTEAIAQLVAKGTGRSIEDARKWVNSEITIANIVMNHPEFLDFEADDRYEPIKKNSDYPQGTVDLSNLCPKRTEFTAMFDMLQKKYPNKLFTANDVAAMRKILKEKGITVACGACFVEDRRQLLGEIADTYIGMWKEAVESGKPLQKTNASGNKVTLTVTAALAKQYGLTKGSEILATDKYIPTQYDLTTYEGFKLLEKNHPTIAMGFNRYNNSRGQQAGRLIEGRAEYNRQILGWSDAKVRSVNNNGGLRIFSFSDFEVVHLLDLVQVIIDCSAMGVKIQGYTKIPSFARLIRDTGIKINRSLIPKGQTGMKMVNGKQVLDYDTTEGIDINDENFINERDNPNVGNILIGINPTQIGLAMLDDFVDYIIPFHTNKSQDICKALGLAEWVNYKESQHEKDIDTGKASKHNVNIYTQVINKYHPTNKVEFVDAFLRVCREQKKIPRYSEFLNKEYKADGTYTDEYGSYDFTYREGYHKLLVDFKMFDHDGNILPQGEISPNLDDAFMAELLKAEVDKKQSYEFPQEVYDRLDKEFGEEDVLLSSRFKVDKYFSRQIDKWESLNDTSYVTVGTIVENSPLNMVGMPDGKLYFDVSKIKKEFETHDDHLSKEVLKQIPKLLAHPIAITEYKPGEGENTVSVYGKLYYKGVPVVVGVVATRGRGGNVVTKIRTVHARGDIQNQITDDSILYLGENKKETNQWFQAQGHRVPMRGTKYGFIRSIAQNPKTVNTSDENPHSDRNKAPTFYSHMGKVVDDIKQDKISANGVVSYLKGRGVKDEEIKWSGIEAFLEGKKSVTKEELREFVAGSMLSIEEEMSGADIDLRYDGTERAYKLHDSTGKVIDTFTYNEFLGGYVADSDEEVYSNEIELREALREEYGQTSAPRWADYRLDGGENYRELVFKMPNSSYTNKAMRVHWGDDAEGVFAHARIQDFETSDGKKMLFIEEIQSDWHNAGQKNGYVDKSKKHSYEVRFETQPLTEKKIVRLYRDGEATPHFNYTEDAEIYDRVIDDWRERTEDEYLERLMEIEKAGLEEVPDAPFRNTYHEYVLKRLIRMAAEEGYDSIGWTPAYIQSFRWSEDYEEGYRIEYDQDIPSFLKKYGKKWGATVGKAEIEVAEHIESGEHYDAENVEVWSMDITDSMKDSVLYEGQVMFSERNKDSVSNRSLLANALESTVTNEVERKTLEEYKEELGRADALERELVEIRSKIRELSFAKGPKDTEALKKLREQEIKTVNRIDIRDKKLLRLEATKPLKDIIKREKDKAYKRAEQKGKEALAKYREKAAETQRELLNRWQESRHKAVEGRNKTAMRHKIKGIVSELNNLLLHGTKDKHVMIGLQQAVASALDAVNMDTVGAEERVAKYNALIAKEKNPDIIESLTATRDRILEQGNNIGEKLANLKNAYSEIKNSDDPLIANSYDEVIFSKIEAVVESVGNTSLRDMSLSQLEEVYDLYKMVLTTIRNSNKAFKAKKGEEISVLGNRVMEEVETVGGKKKKRLKALEWVKQFGWSILKPVYAFKLIGSKTFSEVFDNVRAGEDTWARDVSEAKDFRKATTEKYNYKSWDFKKKYTFTSKSGVAFDLTLEQMLSLYAYSKRKQADDHLEKGGFVFDTAIEVVEKNKFGIPLKYTVNTATAHNLSKETIAEIIGNLTAEQKGFVDEMQDYLSTVMGEKGNEVSLAMYGVKLFKEKFYFPLKSARQFMFEQNEVAGEVRIKNAGFSKETVAHANNPIILDNFMDVWANHVNDMSMYHSFVLALEDFNRVFNYKTPTVDNAPTESVKMYLQNAYGTDAASYIKQLLTDLNGGARSDPQAGIINKAIGKFKKAKVFASLSVVIQQPSAIGRAFAYIDPKYFVGKKVKKTEQTKTWDEVKKYAPIAIIKEMGYFDVGNGRSTVSYLKGDKSVMDYVDDWASWLPAKADELTWCAIWEAVKRETADKNKTLKAGSEEFLKAAGERFTEVIVNTQVYDSVLSRSGMMRSKDTGVKMATAFMAEPTTAMNMMVNAHLQTKRGNKQFARKIRGAVVASIVINSILVSLVYAARDDDEDETYTEKYLGSLTSELIDGFNPLTYLPYVKDLWSIAQGYDVERSDMSMFADLVGSFEKLFDEDESALDKVVNFTGDVTNLFGLPIKNVLRDVKALFNVANGIIEGGQTTSAGIGYSVMDSVRNAIPIWGRVDNGPSSSQKLYNALVSGDKTQIDRLRGGYKDDKAYENAVKKAIRENDKDVKLQVKAFVSGDFTRVDSVIKSVASRYVISEKLADEIIDAEYNYYKSKITDAAKALNEGKTSEYKDIIKTLRDRYRGVYSQDDIVNAVKKKAQDPSVEASAPADEEESVYDTWQINSALENGDTASATTMIEDVVRAKSENYLAKAMAEAEKNGKTFNETKAKKEAKSKAESAVKSAISSYWKPKYKEAYKKGDTEEMKRIRYILRDTKLYGSVSDILDTCKGWLKD